jgi:two-component system, OmpR family, response regulator VicR
MSAAQVLVVEDDRFLQGNLVKILASQGYQATGVASGEEALSYLERNEVDMVVLDLGLPGMDGISTCRRLRASWRMPVLMLTARTDAMDKVLGLEVGADDYLTKPFESIEFVARVRAQLRRVQDYQKSESESEIYVLGELAIDFNKREASMAGLALDLSSREFELLAYLAKNQDRAISRDQIFETVWGYEMDFNTNSLDVYVYRLRKKLEADPDHPKYLHTLRGYGYKLALTAS